MNITWKPMNDPYVQGETCYAGKWKVGEIYFDSGRRATTAPYTATCILPGARKKTVGFFTTEEAKNFLTRVVQWWFAQADQE